MIEAVREKALKKLQDLGFDIGDIESGRTLEDYLGRLRDCPDKWSEENRYISELNEEFGISDGYPLFMDIARKQSKGILKTLQEKYKQRYDYHYFLIPCSSQARIEVGVKVIEVGVEVFRVSDHGGVSTNPTHKHLQESLFNMYLMLHNGSVENRVETRKGSPIADRAIAQVLSDIANYAISQNIPLTLHSSIGNHFVPNPERGPLHLSTSIPDYSRIIYYLPK